MPKLKKKPSGKPFEKGKDPRRNSKGRPVGTPNKVTRAVREFLIDLAEDTSVQEAIRDQIKGGDRGSMQAFLGVVAHVIGQPKAKTEIDLSPKMSRLLLMALKPEPEAEPGPVKPKPS